LGILIFSSGEMFSSPKFLEYIGNSAPSDKKAMYLGFSQLPQTVGWASESYIGPRLYDLFAAKDSLSRDYLMENGHTQVSVDAIPIGEAFDYLVKVTAGTEEQMARMLYEANQVGYIWDIMAVVAFLTAIGLYFYGKWIMKIVRA